MDGNSVVLDGKAKIRTRELERDFLFIGTIANPINISTNDNVVDQIYHYF